MEELFSEEQHPEVFGLPDPLFAERDEADRQETAFLQRQDSEEQVFSASEREQASEVPADLPFFFSVLPQYRG